MLFVDFFTWIQLDIEEINLDTKRQTNSLTQTDRPNLYGMPTYNLVKNCPSSKSLTEEFWYTDGQSGTLCVYLIEVYLWVIITEDGLLQLCLPLAQASLASLTEPGIVGNVLPSLNLELENWNVFLIDWLIWPSEFRVGLWLGTWTQACQKYYGRLFLFVWFFEKIFEMGDVSVFVLMVSTYTLWLGWAASQFVQIQ